jgi:hypothetical protein
VASPWSPPQASPPATAPPASPPSRPFQAPPATTAPPAPSQPQQTPPPPAPHFAAPQVVAGPPPGYPPQGLAAAPPPQPGAPPATASKGWWRRNIWGLIALLPILALALGPSVKEALDRYNRSDAHEAVLPGGDGWVSYSDVRWRLVEFGPATGLTTYDGAPFSPPANTKVWVATVAVDAGEKWATDKYAVAGCNLKLEDSEGRQFTANPTELSGSDPSRRVASCSPEDDDSPTPWEVEIYFVLPESAQPAALRIIRGTELPRYARFPVS